MLFCQRLSARDGRRYRLPTEAEWEWSCRAGTTTQYSCGDDEKQLGQYAWYGGVFGETGNCRKEQYAHAVGQKLANPFGLYDMHGNVWEWCSDWYDSGYYAASPEQDPAGQPPVHRVFCEVAGGTTGRSTCVRAGAASRPAIVTTT